MTETLNEEQIGKVVKYIQKKERLISALNSAVRTAEAPIYAEALNELIILLIEDKLLPDSVNTHKFFPDLYPRSAQKKENKEENPDVQ